MSPEPSGPPRFPQLSVLPRPATRAEPPPAPRLPVLLPAELGPAQGAAAAEGGEPLMQAPHLVLADAHWGLELLSSVAQHADVRAAGHALLAELAEHLRPDVVGSLFLLEPDTGKFRLYANHRLNLVDSDELTLLPQEMFGRRAYETLQPAVATAADVAPFISTEVLSHHRGRVPQQVVTLPLLYEGRCFGLLNLEHYDAVLPLSAEAVQQAMAYCQLVAPTLRHAQLYEQSRLRELDQIQLNKVLHAVNATLDIEAILKTIRRSLGHTYRFDSIAVLLIEPARHELRFQYVHGQRVTPEQQDRYRALRLALATGDSVHVRAIAQLEPIQLNDIVPKGPMAAFDRQAYDIAPFRSAVIFPLVHQQQPIGTIAFVNRTGRTDLAPGQVAYLQRFVAQVVAAIENTRQLDESRAAQRELQIKHLAIQTQTELISQQHNELIKKTEAVYRQSRELEALVKILQVVNEELELDRIMAALLEEGCLLIEGAERGAFLVFDAQERAFRCLAQRGHSAALTERLRLSWREAVERYMPTGGEVSPGVYVRRRHELTPLVALGEGSALAAWGLELPQSLLTLAVTVKGAIQGFLVFDNYQSAQAFDAPDVAKLQRLLEHAASAFYKARYLQLIEQQKAELQEASRKIDDSLAYARRILEAILPRAKDLRAALPDHFVWFEPRDVVSGDFYWLSQQHFMPIVAAVDCTGHGIPGAFMSVLGNTLLNQVVNEKGLTDPGQILNELDVRIKRTLGQLEADSTTLDGMDVALWALDRATGRLRFAGANRPLLHWRPGPEGSGVLTEHKGQRRPAGGVTRHGQEPFVTLSLQLEPGDVVYTFTDGITDQFGGRPAKKYLTSRFKELIASVAHLPLAEQQARIRTAHLQWRGRKAQMDDILVIGMRYTGV